MIKNKSEKEKDLLSESDHRSTGQSITVILDGERQNSSKAIFYRERSALAKAAKGFS